MQNSDKMKAYAAAPYQGLPPGSLLSFDAFKQALKRVLRELHMSLPQEQQMQQLFDKHSRGTEGISEEEFEALLFRLLCFLRASSEVQVQTGTASTELKRDKKWRQEFIQRNNHEYSAVLKRRNNWARAPSAPSGSSSTGRSGTHLRTFVVSAFRR